MRKRGLSIGVWVIVLLGTLTWWMTIAEDFFGKTPNDEEVVFKVEKDSRTGAIYDVQLTRCKHCGQTISWVRFRRGLPVTGYMRDHHDCGRVRIKPQPIDGATFAKPFNVGESLDRWQRRLSH